jgi:hypothetical protein
MRKHLLALTVILTVGTGCDNVEWGSVSVEIVPPPESSRAPNVEVEPTEQSGPDNFTGPILLAGVRSGERASFVVVGEVHPDALRSFPDPDFPEDEARLAALVTPGSEWVLFSEGVRVGRMVTEAAGSAAAYCGTRASVSGVVELVPSAAAAERLLALPAESAAGRPYEPYRAIGHVYDQRVASLTIAGDALREHGAVWPTLGVLDARDHIQAFQLRNAPAQAVAATFMQEDELAIGPPGPRAYALFVMGEQTGSDYRETYAWYREVDAEGKGAPRYFDHLDWDGDGTDEILLDVLGATRRWFAVLSHRDGEWVRTFQDSCGSGSSEGG